MPLINFPTSRLLAASAVAVPLTGSTSETTLATITIPANSLGANGCLRVTTNWSGTNNANAKTAMVRFGGTSGTLYLNTSYASNQSLRSILTIQNRNAANSQVGGGAFGFLIGSSTAAVVTSSVDTTAAVDLVIRGQLATGTDTMTLESYIVEVLRTP